MKIWFDTEFIEDGKTIDLISIGMINEGGDKLYIENSDCDKSKASTWVKENVFPHLSGPLMSRDSIARAVKSFVGPKPELWAYYADYDWVVLCQLYGTMMDLPEGWPMYCRDFKQYLDDRGNPRIYKQVEDQHNALSDAIWLKNQHVNLMGKGLV